jgi:G3E family GTPase
VIESTGIAEPLPVAETFTFTTEEGASLSDVARLDAMVTLVDASNFLPDFNSLDDFEERKWKAEEEDERHVSELLTDQVEFSDIIVVNKCDLVSKEDLAMIHGIVTRLNPHAKVLETVRSEVDLAEILNTNLFSMDKAAKVRGRGHRHRLLV